jgi:signal transduction histidine kinase
MRNVAANQLDAILDDGDPRSLRTLNKFAVDLMSIPNETDLFWYVAQNVVGRLGFVDCVIYTADVERQELTQVAALGEKNPYGRTILNPLIIPFGEGITGKTAVAAEPTVVNDILQNTNYIPDAQPARSEICVPLLAGGQVVGVIDSEHPDANAFGTAELEILTTVAAMTSAKLELLSEAERSQQRYNDLVKTHAKLSEEICSRQALEAELHESRKLEALGHLTGRLAHDFNNLLTVISGNLELAEAYYGEPGSRRYLQEANLASQRGTQLVSDLLAFAQRSRLVLTQTDMNRLVGELCKVSVMPTDVELVVELCPIESHAFVDAGATKSAINAVMTNALEAMPRGGVLTVTTDIVGRSPTSRAALPPELSPGNYYTVSIADTGVGLAPDRVQQVFDPFYSTKPATAGNGLGLSIVRGIMLQSGGTVVASRNEPTGAVIELFFPVH